MKKKISQLKRIRKKTHIKQRGQLQRTEHRRKSLEYLRMEVDGWVESKEVEKRVGRRREKKNNWIHSLSDRRRRECSRGLVSLFTFPMTAKARAGRPGRTVNGEATKAMQCDQSHPLNRDGPGKLQKRLALLCEEANNQLMSAYLSFFPFSFSLYLPISFSLFSPLSRSPPIFPLSLCPWK